MFPDTVKCHLGGKIVPVENQEVKPWRVRMAERERGGPRGQQRAGHPQVCSFRLRDSMEDGPCEAGRPGDWVQILTPPLQ